MKQRSTYRLLAFVGVAIGLVLGVAAIISGSYLLAIIGFGSACRLLVSAFSRPRQKTLPNESGLSRFRRLWRNRSES